MARLKKVEKERGTISQARMQKVRIPERTPLKVEMIAIILYPTQKPC